MKMPPNELAFGLCALLSCATVPIQEHSRYDSLMDYLQHGRKEEEFERYGFFHETGNEISVRAEWGVIKYFADQQGDGYCLVRMTPVAAGELAGWEESIYCSLYGRMLDAYGEVEVELSLVGGKREISLRKQIVGYRRETPEFNGRTWEGLEREFEKVKDEFLQRLPDKQEYYPIAERLRR